MKYIYFRTNPESKNNTDHNGVICVGYKHNPNERTIAIAASFCNPKERFSKKIAHKIINGRMDAGHIIKLVDVSETPPKYEEMVKLIKDELNHPLTISVGTFAMVQLPSWFAGVF